MDQEHLNPFDDERHPFVMLRNAAGQYSLWPTFREVPLGWLVVFGPDARAACLAYVEEAWRTLTPAAR